MGPFDGTLNSAHFEEAPLMVPSAISSTKLGGGGIERGRKGGPDSSAAFLCCPIDLNGGCKVSAIDGLTVPTQFSTLFILDSRLLLYVSKIQLSSSANSSNPSL